KLGHMLQYKPGCNKVYSYLTARSDKVFSDVVFFRLQYYTSEYLREALTQYDGEEFLQYFGRVLGPPDRETEKKIRALCELGYFPVEIKAVPEGTVIGTRQVLMTITNTHPDFYWVVGFIESLLLKVWYPITVASCCYKYRKLVD